MKTFEIKFTVDEHEDYEVRNVNDELTQKFEKLVILARDMRGIKEATLSITDYNGNNIGTITMK